MSEQSHQQNTQKQYSCLKSVGPALRGCGQKFDSWEALKAHESEAHPTSNEYLGLDREELRGIICERDAEIERLRAAVQEWLCEACNTVYPGPPQPGFACVQCPKCKGRTGPRQTIELRQLRAALEKYGCHAHPNCHDLTLKADGSFGPRNGCLCGLDTVLSGRSAPETFDDWRPIETAPLEGAHVLVVDDGQVSEARHIEGEGWYLAQNDPTDSWGPGPLSPTHWMPLPCPPGTRPPPKSAQETSEKP